MTDEEAEAYAMSIVRLQEARAPGVTMFRNNNGVLKNPAGRPVRFGLANESKDLNERLKSADLIGWESVLITPAHVGTVIARFRSREVKRAGWHYTGTPREVAQQAWAHLVNAAGGDAAFTTGEGPV